ncbi:hypothetical protein [Amycolatopsis sp. NPDC051903]|uniref:hypothetical protein n=1 Tax=Amycolatopsis sp. NPDC051903 TaxID=3363936 RepID=UPI00378F44C3
MAGADFRIPGHRLLPHELFWIRRIVSTRRTSGAGSGFSPDRVLRLAAAANWLLLKGVLFAVMVIAFAMEAITGANGGPIQPDGTPMHAWEVPLIVVWWLIISAGLAFLVLGILRLWQSARARRESAAAP